jgi:hypothetical protein
MYRRQAPAEHLVWRALAGFSALVALWMLLVVLAR